MKLGEVFMLRRYTGQRTRLRLRTRFDNDEQLSQRMRALITAVDPRWICNTKACATILPGWLSR